MAAGLLYPFTGLLLSPVIAAAAMSLSYVTLTSNALRAAPDTVMKQRIEGIETDV